MNVWHRRSFQLVSQSNIYTWLYVVIIKEYSACYKLSRNNLVDPTYINKIIIILQKARLCLT